MSSAKVSGDGSGTSGATRGLHEGVGGHGGSFGAPLASFGDVGNKLRSLGAACAGSRVHRGGVLGATVPASGCDGSAPGAIRGTDGNDDSRKLRLRHSRGVLYDRQSSDDGKNLSLVVGPHKAPPPSGDDASLPSDDTSVAITGGRGGSSLGAAHGGDDSDDSLKSRLRHASGTPCARQSLDNGAIPSRFAGPHTAPLLSGYDASVSSAGMAATIVVGHNSLMMRAKRGAKGDDAQWLQLESSPVA